jgi:hypothetical protein
MIGFQSLGVIIVILLSPFPAIAATTAPSAAVRAACGPDARKFCGAVIRDPEARHKCMVEHGAQLSAACKAAVAQSRPAPATANPPPTAAASPTTGAPPATDSPPATDAPASK